MRVAAANRRVAPRDAGKVSVGEMAPQAGGPPALYLSGSDGNDTVSVSYLSGASHVTFALSSGPGFDATSTEEGGCEAVSTTSAVCPASLAPDSIVAAGLAGDDSIVASGFPESTSVVLLGGEGADHLTGGETEDALVDGPGDDEVHAGGGDDAVPNNEGADKLYAEAGEDLFVDDAVCEGDLLDGGPDRDNANWANFKEAAVSIDMAIGKAGLVGPSGEPDCGGGPLTTISNLEDLEGTSLGDVLIGDSGPNQLLGRPGPDRYYAGAGDDSILANSGVPPTKDPDPTIDCGEGWDTALIDFPENGPDASPIDCEDVEERAPNSFRPPGTPPNPNPPAAEASSSPPPIRADRTPPRTRLLHRPARRVFTRHGWRRVAFALGSNEAGSRFRCRIDRRPFRPCHSPRAYRLRLGRHIFRAYAIDAGEQPRPLAASSTGSPCGGSASTRAEATIAAARVAERVDRDRFGQGDGRHDELRDPLAGLDPEGLGRVGVEQQHPHFPPVAGVDQPRTIDQRDPVIARDPRPRQHQPRMPRRNLHRHPGPDAPPLPRPQMRRLTRIQIQPGIPRMRARGQDGLVLQLCDPQLHGRAPYSDHETRRGCPGVRGVLFFAPLTISDGRCA